MGPYSKIKCLVILSPVWHLSQSNDTIKVVLKLCVLSFFLQRAQFSLWFGGSCLWLQGSKDQVKTMTGNKKIGGNIDDRQFKVHDNQTNGSSVSVEGVHTTSSPIPVASAVLTRYGSRGRDLYYT